MLMFGEGLSRRVRLPPPLPPSPFFPVVREEAGGEVRALMRCSGRERQECACVNNLLITGRCTLNRKPFAVISSFSSFNPSVVLPLVPGSPNHKDIKANSARLLYKKLIYDIKLAFIYMQIPPPPTHFNTLCEDSKGGMVLYVIYFI